MLVNRGKPSTSSFKYSERATEGLKLAVEVFKVFNSIESESDELEREVGGMESEDSVKLFDMNAGDDDPV